MSLVDQLMTIREHTYRNNIMLFSIIHWFIRTLQQDVLDEVVQKMTMKDSGNI